MDESLCKEHNISYTHYCEKCSLFFCSLCPCHNSTHGLISLIYLLKEKDIDQHLADCDVISEKIEQVIKQIKKRNKALIALNSEREEQEKLYYSSIEKAKKKYDNYLNKTDHYIEKQLSKLEVIREKCLMQRKRKNIRSKFLEQLMESVKSKYNNEFRNAYFFIKEYRDAAILENIEKDKRALNELDEELMEEERRQSAIVFDNMAYFKTNMAEAKAKCASIHKEVEKLRINYCNEIMRLKETIVNRLAKMIQRKASSHKEDNEELEVPIIPDYMNKSVVDNIARGETIREEEKVSFYSTNSRLRIEKNCTQHIIDESIIMGKSANQVKLEAITKQIKEFSNNSAELNAEVENVISDMNASLELSNNDLQNVRKTTEDIIKTFTTKEEEAMTCRKFWPKSKEEVVVASNLLNNMNQHIELIKVKSNDIKNDTESLNAKMRGIMDNQESAKMSFSKRISRETIKLKQTETELSGIVIDNDQKSVLYKIFSDLSEALKKVEKVVTTNKTKLEEAIEKISVTGKGALDVLALIAKNLKTVKMHLEKVSAIKICEQCISGKIKLKCRHRMCKSCAVLQRQFSFENKMLICELCHGRKREIGK